jgi:hypothetical protein
MSKFKFEDYGDTLRQENEEYEKKFAGREKEIEATSALIVNANFDESAHSQLVTTEAYNKWITKLREDRDNPLLGKSYMMRAPEFERDDEEIEKSDYMDDKKADEILTVQDEKNPEVRHVDDEYNPNVKEVDLSHDEMSRRLVEACIIDNVTQKCIDWKFEDILSECASELEKEFADVKDYSVPDDFDDLVETSLEKAEKLRLIAHESGPKMAIPHLKADEDK